MKKITYLLPLILILACNTTTKKETANTADSKTESKAHKETPTMPSGDYSTLLIDYQCDMNAKEIAEILNVSISKIDLQPNPKRCIIRFSRNGTYESNLTWGMVPSSKKENKKAITKALNNKKTNQAVLGNDIVLANTGDCYLEYFPFQGRINIRNENYESAFQLFYGPRGKRTKEQHEEMKSKMTDLANYLLKKHRK